MYLVKQEVESTLGFDYGHIAKYHDFKEEAILQKKDGRQVKVAYIVQEAILGGELFDFIAYAGAFPVDVCRYYFT